jgi:prolipoprotein diacylglyceryltransferase
MKAWLDRNTTIAYGLLLAAGIFGAWLLGMFDALYQSMFGRTATVRDVSFLDLVLIFAGLIIFCAAGLGFVLLLVRNRKPMSEKQGIAWETVRTKGKWFYVRNFVIRASMTTVPAVLILAFINYWQGTLKENLTTYVFITIAATGCVIYAALNSWWLCESEYKSLQSRAHDDKLSEV